MIIKRLGIIIKYGNREEKEEIKKIIQVKDSNAKMRFC